ncbi:hypothetical protein FHR81_001120 [Actinoalloteichus hoggarensis]|uniref:Uncharacterized protein n=1 Tax=Actinoalloteichus hoggarensis TaxID=1470176 RepID=A0A221VZ88_9PSEU|nr:hypothetical protein [Actinoalloteichus hoggarensis]ASO18855.1 hypothetical protein AHOG_06015 [Actinoalloteichus hoggarensis]MBB5920090.1 hypothetical protein [Actinoalloteichus hoggarensis]
MGLRFFLVSAIAMIASAIVGILLGAVLSTLHADVRGSDRSLGPPTSQTISRPENSLAPPAHTVWTPPHSATPTNGVGRTG